MAIRAGNIAFTVLHAFRFQQLGILPTAIIGDSVAHTIPVPVISNDRSGDKVKLYGENEWFDRLHVLPAKLDVGTIRTTANEQIRLYNAGGTQATITTVSANGGSGINIDHPATPYNLPAFTSALYDVEIILSGPTKINATIGFNSTTVGLLLIVGTRLIAKIWALPPDWSQPVVEIWEWLTRLQTARDQSEFRETVYQNPRRGMRFRIVTSDISMFDRLVSGWQSKLYNVPRWQDRTMLTAAASAGALSLSFNTSIGEWRNNAQIVLLGPDGKREAPVVQSVNVGSVTLTDPLENAWPVGTAVYPSRMMRLPQKVEAERKASGILTGEVEFVADRDTETTYTADDSDTLFESLPVYLVEPNRAQASSADYSHEGTVNDAPGGVMMVDDPDGDPTHEHSWQYDWWTRVDSDAFIEWLFARAGRLNEFWFPTWSDDIKVVAPIQVDVTVMSVSPIEWEEFHLERRNRDVFALQEVNGNWRFARIVGGEIISGVEQLTLDRILVPSPQSQMPVSQIRRICWLEKVRLDMDRIEVAWRTDITTRANLVLRGVA